MNAMKPLLIGVASAFALSVALPCEAASVQKPGSSGHWRGGGGGHGSGGSGSGGHWRGGHGNGGHYGHGHYRGYRGYGGYGYRGYYPWWGFYAAAPFVFGAYYSTWDPYWGYWGQRSYPYAYGGGYPSYPPYYEDVPREPAMSRPGDQDLGPAPSPVDPTAPGAPAQGPLYMNYCASAKAYYPKVTSCPEGWVFQRPKYD